MNTIVCENCGKLRPAVIGKKCWNCGHVPTAVNPQPTQLVYRAAYAPQAITKPTSGQATLLAVLIVMALLFAASYGFFLTPAGQAQWQRIIESIPKAEPNAFSGGGDFSCPTGIIKLEFDARDTLKEPYPNLQANPQRFCFDKAKYLAFLATKGVTESGREISGLDWLAETIAYPDYASMLEEVKTALQTVNISNNLPNVGWIEIPGHGGAAPNPDPQPIPGGSNTTPGNWVPLTVTTPTAFIPPTATAMPTIAAADIPTLMASTPMPQQYSILSFTPEPTQAAIVATAVADVLQQNCVTVVEATDFWDLDSLPFWDQGVTFLEFRIGEDGAYAQSNKVGGDGPDAYKHWACVRQVKNWPGTTLNLGKGITATWNGAQARKSPMYGVGDWISNGMECGSNGLWLFQCSVTYPPGTPTPTPQIPPTATPRATNMSLDDLIALFVKYSWTTQPSCGIDGNQVQIKLGSCSYPNNPSYWVDFSPIWDRYQGGSIEVGPCAQMNKQPKLEWNGTGKCLYPFK